MGSREETRTRRRIGAVAATALAVGVIAFGAAALGPNGPERDTEQGPAQLAAAREDATLDLDLGPVTDPTSCLSDAFAPDAESVDVLYGVHQRTADGSSPVLLLRNVAGELRLCDVAGPDAPAQQPLPEPSDAERVAFLTNGRMVWDCSGTTVDRYTSTMWLAVTPEVGWVQQRFRVDGVPGPWFSTQAQGGYAHLQTWLDGPVPAGAALDVQVRVLDPDRQPVRQSVQPLPGCTEGDVRIG